jgi:hypothetical protein
MSGLAVNPLNPYLHRRLTELFGAVIIANPGAAAVPHIDPTQPGGKVRLDPKGEYYRVNCPFCNDTRKRLWFNHLWGHGVPIHPTDSLWWSATCYNEDCLAVPGRWQGIRDRVYMTLGRMQRHSLPVAVGKIEAAITGPVADPGRCVPLGDLPEWHEANTYLRGRGFDPIHLTYDWHVTYCEQAQEAYRHAEGRLIVPIRMRGEQLSWQARHIGEADWKQTPKYYNCPGVGKVQLLYGFDAAKLLPFVIICEGVTDVWAVGAGAVAVLGKTLSYQQGQIIKGNWKTVVVLLDAEARDEAADVLARLEDTATVVVVTLPAGSDPASLAMDDRDYLWDLIDGTCRAQGVDLIQLA